MTKRVCWSINVGLSCLWTAVFAQTQPTPGASGATSKSSPTYTVISVRLVDPAASSMGGSTPFDETRLVVSLKGLIGYAYDVRPEFIFGGPKWSDSERFDIRAKVDESEIQEFKDLPYEQKAPMMRPVLESRFGLKIHTEVRVLRVFDLVLAKGGLGPKFSLHSPANPAFQLGSAGENFAGYGVEMPLFTRALSNTLSAIVGRPIIDKTGLTGKYDFFLRWSPSVTASSPADQAATSSRPDIFTALQEQLGLKLQPAQEPIEVIVIDSANLPSEN